MFSPEVKVGVIINTVNWSNNKPVSTSIVTEVGEEVVVEFVVDVHCNFPAGGLDTVSSLSVDIVKGVERDVLRQHLCENRVKKRQ